MQLRFGRKIRLPSTMEIKHQLLVSWLNDQRAREAASSIPADPIPPFMTDRAAAYRKRADGLNKAIHQRSGRNLLPLKAKQTALRAMANNEDWLDGKPGTGIRPT